MLHPPKLWPSCQDLCNLILGISVSSKLPHSPRTAQDIFLTLRDQAARTEVALRIVFWWNQMATDRQHWYGMKWCLVLDPPHDYPYHSTWCVNLFIPFSASKWSIDFSDVFCDFSSTATCLEGSKQFPVPNGICSTWLEPPDFTGNWLALKTESPQFSWQVGAKLP